MQQNKLKQFTRIILISACTLFCAPVIAASNSSAATLPAVVKKVSKTVVNIIVEKNIQPAVAAMLERNPQANFKAIASGSGVIIQASHGYILTNEHVVHDAKLIMVQLKSGSRYIAKVVGKSKDFDLAVIQIPTSNLTAIKPGNSDDLQVGEQVAAIGSPFGLSQSVTSGIVSGLNRDNPKIEGIQNFIQTDAPINPGNSGGPLINMHGQLIGINTALFAPLPANVGIGFAIPSNMAYAVAYQLIKYGSIKHSLLGVMAQNINDNLATALKLKNHSYGVLVTRVVPQSPASRAGLKEKDVILSVNQHKIHSAQQLHNMMALTRPQSKISITFSRDNKPYQTHAVVVGMNAKVGKVSAILGGMSLRNFDELQADGSLVHGVQVVNLGETSPAALAGLIPGDVIIQFNNQPINNIKDLKQALESSIQHPLVKVVRGPGIIYLVL